MLAPSLPMGDDSCACLPPAQDLTGSSFRQQVLMDGQYDSISFVCTKTDNIEVRQRAVGRGEGGGVSARSCMQSACALCALSLHRPGLTIWPSSKQLTRHVHSADAHAND